MLLTSLFALLLPLLAGAQDQCNLLPVAVQSLPLYSLVPHTLIKTNTTLCAKYTPASSTQYAWITKLINLAFTGDFVPLPDLWPANPNGTYQATGILDPLAVYRDPCYTVIPINLVPYFNGTYLSTNRHSRPTAVNFLDGGSVPALRGNVPAWSTDSNQYKLFTALYAFFGSLLGCTDPTFPKYSSSNGGSGSGQTEIHRYMDLKGPEMHYFIHNVYDAAVSLGVAGPDLVTHVGDAISIGIALDNIFNKRCSPKQVVVPGDPAELQSMCSDPGTCATWAFPNATCSAYNLPSYGVMPALAPPGEANRCGTVGRSWSA